ncbi:MAG: glycerophosphodiester phosphodiesterase [Armatimonadetes bacterium]|nr:glycerophosphodiester phosphodiesterase [Armatimonadota bacterium]
MSLPLRIAHRGASGSAPENTLAAFQSAQEIGVDLIELDLRATADGVPVILHDAHVDRTTNGSGRLCDLTLEEVRRFDAGGWFAPSFSAERIPTLKETLVRTQDGPLLLIELKEAGLEDVLLEHLHQAEAMNRVVVQSFQFPIIRRLKELEPRLPCGLLLSSSPAGAILDTLSIAEAVLTHGANYAGLSGSMLREDLVRGLRQRGIPVWAWTLDEPDHIYRAMEMGVEGIISNHPERIPESPSP